MWTGRQATCPHAHRARRRPPILTVGFHTKRRGALGFEDEGLAREYLYIDGAWRDHRLFALRNAAFTGVPM
jgi:hypothetical protein